MAAAWLLARPGWSAAFWTLACLLAFWAHEPLLILLGRRGQVQLKRRGPRALALFVALVTAAMAALLVALFLPSRIPIIGFAATLALAGLAAIFTARGRERSLGGELTAGLALVWAALPVALAGGLAPAAALGLLLLWSSVMAAAMLAVRGIIVRAKRGSRAGLLAAAQLAAAGLAAGLALAAAGLLPPRFTLALVPVVAVTLAWLARPPAPRSLRRAGLVLVGANLVTLALLIV